MKNDFSVTKEDIENYGHDFQLIPHVMMSQRSSCLYEAMLWAYIAGREHGKEVHPPIVPVKARWDSHHLDAILYSMPRLTREEVMDLTKIDYTHPLEILPDEK